MLICRSILTNLPQHSRVGRFWREEDRESMERGKKASGEAGAAVARRLRRQAGACRALGSPLYAYLLERSADDTEAAGSAWSVLEGHEADPPGSALALRLMGAVHRLVLQGRAPTLATHYPSAGGEPRDAWPAFRTALEENRDELRDLISRPVQTNEVGRSAALLGGFLLVAKETGLPLRVLELGASAGLNLRWDRYRYEANGVSWGDPASPVRIVDRFVGPPLPPLETSAFVVERGGCDPRPLDPTSEEGRLTLLSYVWADQRGRLRLLRDALAVAAGFPVRVEAAPAADWLAARLADTSAGTATVVYHSIVMQYLDAAEKERLREVFAEAGSRATRTAPLTRLALEPGGEEAELRLTTWPGGGERFLATSGYHGRPVRWRRPAQPAPNAGPENTARRKDHKTRRSDMPPRFPFRWGAWVAPGVLGCAYPRKERSLAALSENGVRLLVNLHGRRHDPARLGRHGLREVHLPVKDFATPSPDQLERGVDVIFEALAAGEAAAVHCGGGLGRTGTLLACYLASSEGFGVEEAIRRVRSLRPGSVETRAQAAAVDAWTRRPG